MSFSWLLLLLLLFLFLLGTMCRRINMLDSETGVAFLVPFLHIRGSLSIVTKRVCLCVIMAPILNGCDPMDNAYIHISNIVYFPLTLSFSLLASFSAYHWQSFRFPIFQLKLISVYPIYSLVHISYSFMHSFIQFMSRICLLLCFFFSSLLYTLGFSRLSLIRQIPGFS